MDCSIFIILLPLFMFLLLGLAGHKMNPKVAGIIGTFGLVVITCLSYYVAYQYFFVVGKVDGIYQQIRPFDIT